MEASHCNGDHRSIEAGATPWCSEPEVQEQLEKRTVAFSKIVNQ